MISNKLAIIKIWTPRAAIIIATVLFLVAFWGIIHFGFRFFEAGSYFTPEIRTDAPVPGIDEERTAKLKDFIKLRAQKRDAVGNYQDLGSKDPFNLP
ncbi:MAG: hypothetical protein V1690_02580 [Candidatus Moraniibacteriota bacterium]